MSTSWVTSKVQIIQLFAAGVAIVGTCVAYYVEAPPWVGAGCAGLSVGLLIGWLCSRPLRGGSRGAALQLVQTEFVKDDRGMTTHKRKLYIYMRNAGRKAVVVGPATAWSGGELPVTTAHDLVWSQEGPKGLRNNDWGKEAAAVVLPPGKHGRTWVGLPYDAKEDDVRSCTQARRAGKLIVPTSSVNSAEISV